MPGRPWTPDEIERLRDAKARSVPTDEIAAALGRSLSGVARKASELGVRRAPVPPTQRFWALVEKRGEDDCWPWLGARDRKGYGAFNEVGVRSDGPRRVTASRFVWTITNGPIPDGMGVLHACDNPPCCNPGHLFVGTLDDNNADAVAKDRHARGSRHGFAKVDEATVRRIRERADGGETRSALAREFGLSATTVDAMVNRKTWRHVG